MAKFTFFTFCILFFFVTSADAQFKTIPNDNNLSNEGPYLLNKKEVKANAEVYLEGFEPKQLPSTENLGLKVGFINESNEPAFIYGQLAVQNRDKLTIEDAATQYVDAASYLMQISDPDMTFALVSLEYDQLDMAHAKFQQKYKGIDIFGSEIIVHGKNNKFDFLNGRYTTSMSIDLSSPIVSEAEAIRYIESDLGNVVFQNPPFMPWMDLTPKSTMVIFNSGDKHNYAYHIIVYKNLIERWEYIIDAVSGGVIYKWSSICKLHNTSQDNSESMTDAMLVSEASPEVETMQWLDGKATATAQDLFDINRLINTYQVGNTFYLIDGSRDIFSSTPAKLPNDPEGVIWTIDAFNTSPSKNNFKVDQVRSNNNLWNNKTGVSAHFNGGLAFEYFRNVHGRRSINGSGGNIVSVINVADDDGKSMGNAFWNGQAMFYGNGDNAFLPLARGLDVAGHEMSHGVIQATANLVYQGESGALNESFADVFGVMIDRDDWKIGEDVVRLSAFPSGSLRSLENPHNGANTNDFNKGWQPRHYSERYTGKEDNEGVHINSGIPNWAFFKFATAVGKDKAEKVYYRALSNYLTKSSKFVDCRVAVVKATQDLYGDTEVAAARKAFDEVGILGDSGGSYEDDLPTNPGQDFILVTGTNNQNLFILNDKAESLGQISSKKIISKPSVSDDGSEIIYVADDNHIYLISIDWSKNPATFKEDRLSQTPDWRGAIISRDGIKVAGLLKSLENKIYVFAFLSSGVVSNSFELFNPTYTQGVVTGDVLYADAMEFDHSSEHIMYDAENEIKSNFGSAINYWDIGFIKVWNNSTNTFSLGGIEKLYSSLPNGVSVGNATFSKNSPYILAFDLLDGDKTYVVAGNLETGNVNIIYENNTIGYPNYSNKDDKLLFDNQGNTAVNLGIANLKPSKVEINGAPSLFLAQRRWAVWFSNGKRPLSASEDVSVNDAFFTIIQNPIINELMIKANNLFDGRITVTNVTGSVFYSQVVQIGEGEVINVDASSWNKGIYFVTFVQGENKRTTKVVKI